jgi:hypothetical protein
MDCLPTGRARPQATECPQHFVHPVGRSAEHGAQRLYAGLICRGSVPLGGCQRGVERLRSVRTIEDLDTTRPRLTKSTPVVWRPIGHCAPPYIGTLQQGPHHFGGPLLLARGCLGLRHPGPATRAQTRSMAVIRGDRRTAYCLRACRATGRFAHGTRVGALGLALPILHRGPHPSKRYGHRHRLGGDRCLVASRRCTPGALRLPVATQRVGPPVARAFRRGHVPAQGTEFFALLGGQMVG